GLETTLNNAHARSSKQADTLITGRGDVVAMDELKEYAAFNHALIARASAAYRAEKTVGEALRSWNFDAKYANYAAINGEDLQNTIKQAYDEWNKASAFGNGALPYERSPSPGRVPPAQPTPPAAPAPSPTPAGPAPQP